MYFMPYYRYCFSESEVELFETLYHCLKWAINMTNCIKTIHLIISEAKREVMWCWVMLLHQVLDVVLKSVQIGFQWECVCVRQRHRAVEVEPGQQFHITYASRVSAQHLLHPVRWLLQALKSKWQQRWEGSHDIIWKWLLVTHTLWSEQQNSSAFTPSPQTSTSSSHNNSWQHTKRCAHVRCLSKGHYSQACLDWVLNQHPFGHNPALITISLRLPSFARVITE